MIINSQKIQESSIQKTFEKKSLLKLFGNIDLNFFKKNFVIIFICLILFVGISYNIYANIKIYLNNTDYIVLSQLDNIKFYYPKNYKYQSDENNQFKFFDLEFFHPDYFNKNYESGIGITIFDDIDFRIEKIDDCKNLQKLNIIENEKLEFVINDFTIKCTFENQLTYDDSSLRYSKVILLTKSYYINNKIIMAGYYYNDNLPQNEKDLLESNLNLFIEEYSNYKY